MLETPLVSRPSTVVRLARASRMLAGAVLLAAGASACDAPPEARRDHLVTHRAGAAATFATASLGSDTTCITSLSGRAKCWGLDDHGQLGQGAGGIDIDADGGSRPADLAYITLGGVALDVQSNGLRSFALMGDGRVLAWGDNTAHALGLGHTQTIGDDEDPSGSVVELGAPAVGLAVGEDFACARLSPGLVRCWGANDHGQLGLGHTERIGDDELPGHEPPVPLDTPIESITAGRRHACALQAQDGSVHCWGANDHGQLGSADPVLTDPVDLLAPAVQVVAGGLHTCARLHDDTVQCWGDNAWGQLGYGHDETIGDDETPAFAGRVALGAGAVDLALGREHTCALLDTGALNCWGRGDQGQLGRGSIDPVGITQTPQKAGPLDMGTLWVESVHAGPLARSTCAYFDDEELRCWGGNGSGQLGYGTRTPREVEEIIASLPDIVVYDDDTDS